MAKYKSVIRESDNVPGMIDVEGNFFPDKKVTREEDGNKGMISVDGTFASTETSFMKDIKRVHKRTTRDIGQAIGEVPENVKIGANKMLAGLSDALAAEGIVTNYIAGTSLGFTNEETTKAITGQKPTTDRERVATEIFKAAKDPNNPISQHPLGFIFGLSHELTHSREKISKPAMARAERVAKRLPDLKWKSNPIAKASRLTIQDGIPSMTVAIAASMATGSPMVGLAVLGESTFGTEFFDQLDNGASIPKAMTIARLSEAAEIGTESMVFPKIMKTLGKGISVREGFKILGENAGQEYLAGFSQTFMNQFGILTSEGMGEREAAQKSWDTAEKAAPESALVGALTPLSTTSVSVTRGVISQRSADKARPLDIVRRTPTDIKENATEEFQAGRQVYDSVDEAISASNYIADTAEETGQNLEVIQDGDEVTVIPLYEQGDKLTGQEKLINALQNDPALTEKELDIREIEEQMDAEDAAEKRIEEEGRDQELIDADTRTIERAQAKLNADNALNEAEENALPPWMKALPDSDKQDVDINRSILEDSDATEEDKGEALIELAKLKKKGEKFVGEESKTAETKRAEALADDLINIFQRQQAEQKEFNDLTEFEHLQVEKRKLERQIRREKNEAVNIKAADKGLVTTKGRTNLYKHIAKQTTGVESTKQMTEPQLRDFERAIDKTTKADNTLIEYDIAKTNETNAPIDTTDKRFQKINKHRRRRMKKSIQTANHKMVASKKGGKKFGYFKWYIPTRNAMARFEQQTGIPVFYLNHKIEKKADIAAHAAEIMFAQGITGENDIAKAGKMLSAMIANTSHEGNERIKQYLFSEVTRQVVLDEITALENEIKSRKHNTIENRRLSKELAVRVKEIEIAQRFNFMLQEGPIARERMEEIYRKWITYRDQPADVKDKYDKKQIKQLLQIGKKALRDNNLKEITNKLFDGGIRFGLMENYYKSEKGENNAILNYLQAAKGESLTAMPDTDLKSPSVFGSSSFTRHGVGAIKPGPVYNTVMDSFKRVMIRNAVAKDTKEIYSRFNQVEIAGLDAVYLTELYEKILRKGELATPPFDRIQKLNGLFWTLKHSLLINPLKTLNKIERNGLQPLAETGQTISANEFRKKSSQVAGKMLKNLATGRTYSFAELDTEMYEDFLNSFDAYVSAKDSLYRDSMFRDLGAKLKESSDLKKMSAWLKVTLDKTGKGYVGIDTLDRKVAWASSYLVMKEAATLYKTGQINSKGFLNRTLVDTMMEDTQTKTMIDLLEAGKIRELSNIYADITTFDIHRAYKIPGRAGVERTSEKRALVGIYTFIRGRYDLYYSRGMKQLMRGAREGNLGKMNRAATSIGKGLLGSAAADALLIGVGGKASYHLLRGTYNLLQPAQAIIYDMFNRINAILSALYDDDIDEAEAIDKAKDAVIDSVDQLTGVIPD